MNPFAMMSLNVQLASLILDTQAVMALRMMGMAGALPQRRGENERMVSEKAPAMAKAYAAATQAVMSGKRPDEILTEAMKPVSRKVRANRKRLMK